MKKYFSPLLSVVELDAKDIIMNSITLRDNPKGDDDGSSIEELFG